MGTLGRLLRAVWSSGARRVRPVAAGRVGRALRSPLGPNLGGRQRWTGTQAADEEAGTKPPPNFDLSRVMESSDAVTEAIIRRDFQLSEDFVSQEEADRLMDEVEDYLEDLEYEYDHWDNAIHGYRETEKSRWSAESEAVLQRIRRTAFPAGEQQLSLVHVLDLAKDGFIKPHVDSLKFCGSTITGLSLLSPSVMRLAKESNPERWVQLVLRPRSLYVMKGRARYEYTHEILKDSESVFRGQKLARDRRISIMCRNEPS